MDKARNWTPEVSMVSLVPGETTMTAVLTLDRVMIGDDRLDDDGHVVAFGLTAGALAEALDRAVAQGASDVLLRINSPGGNLVEALAMCDHIRGLSIPVHTEVFGLCASAATLLALMGATVSMNEHATFMVHMPEAAIVGTTAEMESFLAFFRDQEEKAFRIYAEKTGKEVEVLRSEHATARYYNAESALAYGFVDAIKGAQAQEEGKDAASVNMRLDSALPRKGLFGIGDFTARMAARCGIPYLAARREESENAALKKSLVEMAAQMQGLQEQVAAVRQDDVRRQEAFQARVSMEVEKALIGMGLSPSALPAPSAETPRPARLAHGELAGKSPEEILQLAARGLIQ